MCPATLENTVFFLDSYVASCLEDENQTLADFQVINSCIDWLKVSSLIYLADMVKLAGMVSLLVASKFFGTGLKLKVVSIRFRRQMFVLVHKFICSFENRRGWSH
jgi:hypothetical protein